MTAPDKLVILDYSGTLSLEAPNFAEPDRLVRELAASGLADFGIATPALFWEQLVNPTWTEGSTTQSGYKQIIAERATADGTGGLGRLLIPAAGAAPARIVGAGATFAPDAPAVLAGGNDITALASAGGTLVVNTVPVVIPPGAGATAIREPIPVSSA